MRGRIKQIQVEQFNYAYQQPGTSFDYYPIAGAPQDGFMPRPQYPLIGVGAQRDNAGNFTHVSHPTWGAFYQFALSRPDSNSEGYYDSSTAFGRMMDSMTPKDAGDNKSVPNDGGFCGQYDRCNFCYFPVVYRISPVHLRTSGIITRDYERIAICPFRVLASSWEYEKQHEDDYDPEYREITVNTRHGVKVVVHLDVNYLADDGNTYMAVMASVLSLMPGRWYPMVTQDNTLHIYLTIAPAIDGTSYQRHVSVCKEIMGDAAPEGDACFVFEGASLGLAVAAAIMGCPSFLYTGYNSQMGNSEILTDDPKLPVQNVALGANFVEPVDDVEFKTAGAILMGLPIIIPLNVSWYTEPTQQALYRGVARALGVDKGRRTLLALAARKFAYPVAMQKQIALATNSTNWAATMSNFIYTAAKRDAGHNYDMLPSLVLAAVNLSDVQILAAHAAAYLWAPVAILVKGGAAIDESQKLARDSNRVRRAMDLAKHAGEVDLKASREYELHESRARNKAQDEYAPEDPWDLDNIRYRGPLAKRGAKSKSKAKAKGRSGGKVKKRKVTPKRAAPKRKKATKRKSKAKRKKAVACDAPVKKRKKRKTKAKKGGKKKAKGKKRKARKTTKRRKTKKRKQVEFGSSSGRYGIGFAAGLPMDKRIGRQIPLLSLNRKAKDAALAFIDPSARSAPLGGRQTARHMVRQAMLARIGGKVEKPVRFS